MTQHGLRCRVPIFHTASFAIAALCCFDEAQGSHLGLLLTPCQEQSSPPLYHPGWTPPNGLSTRIVLLGNGLEAPQFNGQRMIFVWEDVYIAPRPPVDPDALFGGFRLPRPMIAALIEREWMHIPNTKIPHGWKEPHSFDLLFDRAGPEHSRLFFAMGRCSQPEGSLAHWASFWLIPMELPDNHCPPSHHCPDDHVSKWPDGRKLFTARYSGHVLPFAVAFSPCDDPRDEVLVLRVAEGKTGRVRCGDSWFGPDELHHITPWTLPPADDR